MHNIPARPHCEFPTTQRATDPVYAARLAESQRAWGAQGRRGVPSSCNTNVPPPQLPQGVRGGGFITNCSQVHRRQNPSKPPHSVMWGWYRFPSIKRPYIWVWFCTVLEFQNDLWGLGTEKEKGCRTGPPGYIHRLAESIPGFHKSLKTPSLYWAVRLPWACQPMSV